MHGRRARSKPCFPVGLAMNLKRAASAGSFRPAVRRPTKVAGMTVPAFGHYLSQATSGGSALLAHSMAACGA
jgi:hypothetical protein